MPARHSQIAVDVQDLLVELAADPRLSATQIHRKLDIEFPSGQKGPRDLAAPSLRTVQRMVREIRSNRDETPWDIRDYDGDDARIVLDHARRLYWRWGSAGPGMTKSLAEWILRIHKIGEGKLEWNRVFILASLYEVHHPTGTAEIRALDLFLASKPWVNPQYQSQYEAQVESDLLPRPPAWNWLMLKNMEWLRDPWNEVSQEIGSTSIDR